VDLPVGVANGLGLVSPGNIPLVANLPA
jgi:hypothetical protein